MDSLAILLVRAKRNAMRNRARAIAIAKRIDEERTVKVWTLMLSGLLLISIIIGLALSGALPSPV